MPQWHGNAPMAWQHQLETQNQFSRTQCKCRAYSRGSQQAAHGPDQARECISYGPRRVTAKKSRKKINRKNRNLDVLHCKMTSCGLIFSVNVLKTHELPGAGVLRRAPGPHPL